LVDHRFILAVIMQEVSFIHVGVLSLRLI
jgi:hypothetical protein